ncbi:MAG: hypothetical protein JXA33_06060 [Anaerolineae bacterium]|nr:hypothetical protein [Anaerolineae bacterium]
MLIKTILTKILRFLWPAILLLSACGVQPSLTNVSVYPSVITPNGDGQHDASEIKFTLRRNATVSIYLDSQNKNGKVQRFVFRPPSTLSSNPKPYTVYFNGVVENYTHIDDPYYDFEIVKRMLPDGDYTWHIIAEDTIGTQEVTGTLTIQNADILLPGIQGFSIYPKTFSPNQDGIDDRVTVNLILDKDVTTLHVYLLETDETIHYIPEDETRQTHSNAKGWHTFDYDGGIDVGNDPPSDGTYIIYAEAQDSSGQHVIVSDTLTIRNAGLPRAYIANGEVTYSTSVLELGDTLCYSLTVENDSNTYLRTTGPWSGATYRSDQNFNTLGWSEESGVFRVGMDFEGGLRNYPFRWGIGRPDDTLVEIEGYWYLPPRVTSIVTGCIQVVEYPASNSLYYWMGLIHEDVAIAEVNNHVDAHAVTIKNK